MFGFGYKTTKYQNIGAEEFRDLMNDKNAVVLDVRTPAETQDGVIPGYKMINLMSPDFMDEIKKLDKDKIYLVYCRSGNRSGQACNIMADQGFTKLYNLVGGIGAWR
ncbi:rhodanese-like domain-containing protein [Fulvivirga sp. 29W222]|uniref:Rhodanese-like domain-containing protein n=2 Tax=Fulvivirga marina TaxID=2494733 RepID=A0A937G0K9_9BACT|nr:rhodanese-like domain-containing protein [Fulvivirga marina]MBL6448432.1 rhodanese-like domain-containing protein [Fulvivirga marina]